MYHLSEIPEGYELYEEISDNISVYISYINYDTNRCLTFVQNVKYGYREHFDNTHQTLEELEINGNYAIYFDSSGSDINSGIIVWDNDDYISEVSGDFNKEELLNLAKSAKILKNKI